AADRDPAARRGPGARGTRRRRRARRLDGHPPRPRRQRRLPGCGRPVRADAARSRSARDGGGARGEADVAGGGRPAARQAPVAHLDRDRVALAEELRRRYPQDPNSPRGVANVIRTGEPELYDSVTDAELAEHAIDAENVRILRELGARSVMIVPLGARGRTLGA